MVRGLTAAGLVALATLSVHAEENNSTITTKFQKANTTYVPAITKVPKAVWTVLNGVVGGRLYTNGAPFSRPCFANGTSTGSLNANTCSSIQANYLSNVPNGRLARRRKKIVISTIPTHPTQPHSRPQRHVHRAEYRPIMQIDVRNGVDVIAAFVFSRLTSVPLVIKNSGHDYKGRSSAPNALTLWTHNIKYINYNAKFQPDSCSSVAATPAVTYGAGQDLASLYQFAEDNGLTFLGGTDKTVGAAGGWVQGGGHGMLSNTLGLGVDRVLQFKVVTPDGLTRTANACQNSDLFWALRGGGGGTFGVVLEATSRVEPKIPTQSIFVKFNPVTAHVVAYMSTIIENSVQWAEDGWGGYISPNYAIFATPKLNRTEAEASMAPLTQVVASFGSDVIKNEFTSYDTFLPLFNNVVANAAAPVGRPFTMATRIVPAANFVTAEGRSALLSAMLSAFTTVGGAAQIMVTAPYSYNATSPSDVSVTPAWRNALWHTLLVGFWNYNSTAEQQAAVYSTVSAAADKLRAITPGSGAYQNEADVSEPDHESRLVLGIELRQTSVD
ncbi:oxygen-dependent FAD-linked oxidoreductase family [Rhizoctonia solani]|uniref:Oxygen-dependent FAD-linked oxidoreductase family n=1 Tax=Rhizoctonia solani TaxID=456999 RepID=A0A8H7HGI8_9AGAM|nr:oxygen-dependent FAD-linked oxidoreductase family [Rhizoctonia solani]KAF8752368.1 oxygen-dependent FAD-linked oxidoreductase family [Rhizoctonia solani]